MAQQNRRKSRKGGSTTRKSRPRDESSQAPGTYESGEEQLTEAQAAFGRPEVAERPSEQQLTDFEEADASRNGEAPGTEAVSGGGGGGSGTGTLVTTGDNGRGGSGRGGDGHGGDGHGGGASRGPGLPMRTVGFVKGSWRELQRVQWPDRRQVFQATGVVLGFVIVAGAFLGLASFAAEKIVNLILYGHG